MGRNGVPSSTVAGLAVTAFELMDSSNWWHDINESPLWQDRIFHVLAALYGIVAIVALVYTIFVVVSVFIYLLDVIVRLIWLDLVFVIRY